MKTKPSRGKGDEAIFIIYLALGYQSPYLLSSCSSWLPGGCGPYRFILAAPHTPHTPALSKSRPALTGRGLPCRPLPALPDPLPETRSPNSAPSNRLRGAPVTKILLSPPLKATVSRHLACYLPKISY